MKNFKKKEREGEPEKKEKEPPPIKFEQEEDDELDEDICQRCGFFHCLCTEELELE